MIQILRFSFNPPEIGDKDIYEYMCTDFINGVRECFKNGGFIQTYSDGDEKGGTFLVAYKKRLFKIQNDFQVGETMNGFDACGVAADFALGVMYTLEKEDLTTEEKLMRALDAASFLSVGVKPPFVFVST